MKELSLLIALSAIMFPRIENEYLMITDRQTPCPNGYEEQISSELEPIIHTRADGRPTQYMIKEAALALDALLYAADDAGFDITVTSAYRSYEYQKTIYELRLSTLIASGLTLDEAIIKTQETVDPPGYSEHQTGLAVDMYSEKYALMSFQYSDEFKWLCENAPRYGFILRYPKGKESVTGHAFEPWHFRFVGKCAEEMTKKELILEEYVENK